MANLLEQYKKVEAELVIKINEYVALLLAKDRSLGRDEVFTLTKGQLTGIFNGYGRFETFSDFSNDSTWFHVSVEEALSDDPMKFIEKRHEQFKHNLRKI